MDGHYLLLKFQAAHAVLLQAINGWLAPGLPSAMAADW
jgi:hypothetical protein